MLAYCDYIATQLRKGLLEDGNGLLSAVFPVRWDLDAQGAFVSTKKSVDVVDLNGKQYRITVEEI